MRFLIHVLINNLPDATPPPLQFSTPPQFDTAEGLKSSKTQYFAGSTDLDSDMKDADTNFDWVSLSCLKNLFKQLQFHGCISVLTRIGKGTLGWLFPGNTNEYHANRPAKVWVVYLLVIGLYASWRFI